MSENKEIPVVIFRRLLPFISVRDMPNVEKAVMASPKLYNEYSFHTRKHSSTCPESRMICPYCLVTGGLFNPWNNILITIWGMDPRVWELGHRGLALYKSGPYILVEAETLDGITSKSTARKDLFRNQSIASHFNENKFRRYTQMWAEEMDRKDVMKKFLLALRNLKVYDSPFELVSHIEAAHNLRGPQWRKTRFPVHANNMDEITDFMMAKQFIGSVQAIPPRKNKSLHEELKLGAARRKRRQGGNPPSLNTTDTINMDSVQSIHRSLSLLYWLEDTLERNPRRHLITQPRLHKLLALRDFLACQMEVCENIAFDQLPRDNATHFGIINAVKLVLDSLLKLPY